MPTNLNMLFPPFPGRNVRGSSDSRLLCPGSREQEDEVFLAIHEEEDLPLTLRPISPAEDLFILCQCMQVDYAPIAGDQDHRVKEAYSSILASDATQTFIGRVGEEAICELDICKIRQHAMSLSYQAPPGDYFLEVLPIPSAPQKILSQLIHHALRYFFSFSEVSRIAVEAGKKDENRNALWQENGFRWHRHIEVDQQASNLYIRRRNDYGRSSTSILQ